MDFCLGTVAFVVGGADTSVELYSPNGNCSTQLAAVPASLPLESPVLGILDGKILACENQYHNYRKCWTYNSANDSWSLYTESRFGHNNPGIVYKNKLYIVDSANPEIFDPLTKIWSPWPVVLAEPYGGCLVGMADLVIVDFNKNWKEKIDD